MNKIRRDNPIQMSLHHQEHIGSLIDILESLKDKNALDPDLITDIVYPHFNFILPDLGAFYILSYDEIKLKCIYERNLHKRSKSWKKINQSTQNEIKELLNDELSSNDVNLSNYENTFPLFTKGDIKSQAVAISWLCEHPDNSNLFIAFVRCKRYKPFLCHEVQAIKLASRILGFYMNYAFTYQLLKVAIKKSFRKDLEQN